MFLLLSAVLSFLLFPQVSASSKFVCLYYPQVSMTERSCKVWTEALQAAVGPVIVVKKPISSEALKTAKDGMLYVAGFGWKEGLWMDVEGEQILDWCEFVRTVTARVVFVDACYSGELAKCELPAGKIFVTSTGKQALSVNVPSNSRWGNVSAFVAMLWCMTRPGVCKEASACEEAVDPQLCQLQLSLLALAEYWPRLSRTLSRVWKGRLLHEDLQVGLVHVNGKPLREWPGRGPR